MKLTKDKIYFGVCGVLLLLFIAFTILVKFVDVQAVGPLDSEIGFAWLNAAVHNSIGESGFWCSVSEILGIITLAVAAIFACLGLVDAIRGKSIRAVQSNTIFLGAVYCLAVGLYMFFEFVIINFRPVLEDGALAASYPSSHTLLACVVMGSCIVWLMKSELKKPIKLTLIFSSIIVGVGGIIARFLSGQHWLTDILGGLILGISLLFFYVGLVEKKELLDKDKTAQKPENKSDLESTAMTDIAQ